MRDDTRADVPDETGSEILDEVTLRALIEHVPATVYIDRLDETGSNVYTSPRLEAELGYTVQEWVSDKELYAKVLHPEDREGILAEYRRTRDTDEPFRAEYRMIARDGTGHWYLDEAAVIRDEAGPPAHLHCFRLDITDPKLAGSVVALVALHKDGREFPLELSIGAWASSDGPAFSGVIRDITEPKQLADALRSSEEELRRQKQYFESLAEINPTAIVT